MEVKINLNQEQAAPLLDFLQGVTLWNPVGVKSRNPADR